MSSQHNLFGVAPLAESLRPQRLSDVLGQDHLGEGLFGGGALTSVILWGPPGSGKTTIARLLAKEKNIEFRGLSAVLGGLKELREIFAQAEKIGQLALFIDEIHRFSRTQQDAFLPHVETGRILLIGATTENPSFALTGALLSRCRVVVLHPLSAQVLEVLLQRGEEKMGKPLPVTSQARELLLRLADGDGRNLLNTAEYLFSLKSEKPLDGESLLRVVQRRALLYDKAQEEHYNLISALHKSIRGSDPDASLYWLARMFEGGEDPRYVARRVLRIAVEDIGLADANAMVQALSAWQAFERMGSPEGELAIAQAVVYCATAPKSNAVYRAMKLATKVAKEGASLPPPLHIRNAPTQLMKDLGYGKGYQYDPNEEHGFSGQEYFPEGMSRQSFYQPLQEGKEKAIASRLKAWQALRPSKLGL